MEIDFIALFFKYGLPVLNLAAIITIGRLLIVLKKELDKVDREVMKVKNAQGDQKCAIHEEQFATMGKSISDLEKDAVSTGRDMKTIFSKVDEVGADVKKILHFYAQKGMEGSNGV